MIAIMQGRLGPPEAGRFQSFPRQRWREEFAAAGAAGLDAIEWIFDKYGESANPLGNSAGIDEMLELSRTHGVVVRSVCADYFMDRPIVSATADGLNALAAKLEWLIRQCARAGIGRIVLPFVDQSRMSGDAHVARVISFLRDLLPAAANSNVELHLETDMPPDHFAALVEQLPSEYLKINYDIGNSAALGYDAAAEMEGYGARIGSVHVKDRLRRGGTVALGTGAADLPGVFAALVGAGYSGDYVLQVARTDTMSEVDWAIRNRTYLAEFLRVARGAGGTA